MTHSLPDASPREVWTLLRGARQLLTLRGPSGPRRGPALNELSLVKDGAILICNGVIQEVGAARRIENLKQARYAREIDAGGGVVMPAFVDPDAILVYPPVGEKEARLRVMSKHRLLSAGATAAADWVRSGVLSVGANTGFAANLRDTLRILRIHQSLQAKPLRIRSIYCPATQPGAEDGCRAKVADRPAVSLEAILKRKLAAIAEFATTADADPELVRQAAVAASESGYSIRLRITGDPERELLALALEASSVAVIASPMETVGCLRSMADLGTLGCVHVLAVAHGIGDSSKLSGNLRREIGEGIPIAIASGYRDGGAASMNPQFLLYLAVERCGMTGEEAIVASTYNAACSLRMSHVTGSLEPGKAADLLVMDVADHHDLIQRVGHNDVRLAVRAGHVVYRRGSLTVD